ncbi:Hypothetical predicted protein, partial [Paramuricea clavata]
MENIIVASLKPEISGALDSLLHEINSANDAKVLRTAFQQSLKHTQSSSHRQTHTALPRTSKTPTKSCSLCKQGGRPTSQSKTSNTYPAQDRHRSRNKTPQSFHE